ncbi:serine protease [Streptomyces sp. UNOC14_S4]|uniref:serine protease n=1 Tax=Streptomyces sp. UNOC14_S4 TaxID=2872340 RepID=UPI001E3EA13A|nr:serine protease [Streptomyces sp. UNOC14_S4]MCC3769017.1 serine protease [Streptomyces sp. UNOC14_S4]
MLRAASLLLAAGLLAGAQCTPAAAIEGGTPAGSGEDLWDVAFLHLDGSLACAGSVIGPTAIVTSASCVDGESGIDPVFRYGSHDDTSGGSVATVGRVVIHPNYNSRTHDYDIAVVRPLLPLTLGTTAQPIALPAQGTEPAPGTGETVSGWGRVSGSGSLSTDLLQTTLPAVARSTCQSAWGSVNTITARMICAGTLGQNVGPCDGDRGGPLVAGSGSSAVLVGLVSWGPSGCSYSSSYSVYANVGNVRSWIGANSGV